MNQFKFGDKVQCPDMSVQMFLHSTSTGIAVVVSQWGVKTQFLEAKLERIPAPVKDNPIQQILEWFKTAKPEPTEKDKATQLGAHFEEVAEMQFALGAENIETERLSTSFYRSDSIHVNEDGQDVSLPEGWKEQLLDAMCDQIVTVVGVSYMLGMDIEGALAEVIRSNNSKFVDGKPMCNEYGKIVKPDTYSPPNLKPFLKGKE